jgi:hypothetical protein
MGIIMYKLIQEWVGGSLFPTDVAYDFMYNWLMCFSGEIICKIIPVFIFIQYLFIPVFRLSSSNSQQAGYSVGTI